MDPKFELWDTATGNLIGIYNSITTALNDITQAFAPSEDRSEIADYVLVVRITATAEPVEVLGGDALLKLSQRDTSSSSVVSAPHETVPLYQEQYRGTTLAQSQALSPRRQPVQQAEPRHTAVAPQKYQHLSYQEASPVAA